MKHFLSPSIMLPENPVLSIRYGDQILFFYLAFVHDTISFLRLNFLRNLIPGTNNEIYFFNIEVSNL